ncbi:MAG: DMT family transporter, partial [Bacteroidales bacterium]|nr:DMT family transporter [Bacteroidales bacterium]
MGELIALIVAFSWTITALFAEIASKKIGSTTVNVIRMALSLILLAILLWVTTGAPYPQFADRKTWLWLIASGLVGYVFGDFCLFNSYLIIGSRFGQLFMTLSSVFAAFAGFLLLGETMALKSLIAMAVTLTGIGISVMAEKEGHAVVSDDGLVAVPEKKFNIKSLFKRKKVRLKVPFKGVLLGIGAAMG